MNNSIFGILQSGSFKSYYYIALILGLLFHGSILFFTFEKTYDAYVHMFFAEHYASAWFESWNAKWYTGFTITSYPPLVHQIIALFSKLIGLKLAFYIWSLCAVFLLIRGVYKFSLLWVDQRAAGIAAILAVFSSSIVEALHIFGQLPSLTGIAFLLNACPEVYKWFRHGRWINFFLAIALLTVTTTAHHVSTIFGMVFFVLPVIATAIIDLLADKHGGIEKVTPKLFIGKSIKLLPKLLSFGFLVIGITIFVIFPYWFWSKTDPISQVPIPHGSRENFLSNPNLGIIFFLIPWGMMLMFLPYLAKRILIRRNIFLALSIGLAFLLGTGGTTPIPRMLLGETAYNILTLDRFTFWATMLSLPFWGAFFKQLLDGDFNSYLKKLGGAKLQKGILAFFSIGIILSNVLIVNLGNFKPFQPESIDIKPITNFLSRDQHDNWRYLTLGFGDQMAWLSANTDALTVDGNYHSARRLPEMTTRAVERLENAKYQKMEGIGALEDFLSTPEKYNLKYVFSNDKFYEPTLHFNGWTKIQTLENSIVVWEYPDVPPLQKYLPSKNIPKIQRMMWGILPLSCFGLAFIIYILSRTKYRKEEDWELLANNNKYESSFSWPIVLVWTMIVTGLLSFASIKDHFFNHSQSNPENLALAYFDALDFRKFENAYALLDPDSRPSYDQFILELSVEDGILASFSKLDELNFDINQTENEAKVFVEANWVTSLNDYVSQHQLEMIKRNGKWFLKKDEFEKNIPTNQFFSLADLDFKNQGRRKANVNQTNKEDILDRPEVHIIQSSLNKNQDGHFVVGSIQNIDNVPAFVTIEAKLYDEKGNEIDKAKVAYKMVHDLMPKETTPFRIDFEGGPYYYEPTEVVLFVRSLATDKELYKFHGIKSIETSKTASSDEVQISDKLITGQIINYGTKEINIPQLLFAQYDDNKNIYWVDYLFLQKGIRPQRKKSFQLELEKMKNISTLGKIRKIYVNGVPNDEMLLSNMANDKSNFLTWKKIDQGYLELKVNGYVYELNK